MSSIKGLVAGLAAGIALGAAGTAVAGGGVTIWETHAGITCGFGSGPHGRGVACAQTFRRGYGATVTRTEVLVWRDSRVVFERLQPK
jgi:hypothetical protein